MTAKVTLACDGRIHVLGLDRILPVRIIDKAMLNTAKGRCIRASIEELGIIEPLVVHPQTGSHRQYMLLDGHVRLAIIKELNWSSCKCLIATDDEAFTYNHKVSRLSAIQEHFMILRAIENGVSEIRLAKTLNVDISKIRQKRNLLDGICSEAVALLKDTGVRSGALRELRRVKPIRQIEIAELMCTVRNISENYAKCLVAASPNEQLIESDRPMEFRGLSSDELTRLEMEIASLSREFKVVEESLGKNTLNLVVALAYVKKLLDNARIVRFLSQRQPEILAELQKILDSRSTDGKTSRHDG